MKVSVRKKEPLPEKRPEGGHARGCLLCGKPLRSLERSEVRRCALCGRSFESPWVCEDGHYVCDECHAAGSEEAFLPLLLHSTERDPLRLLEQVMDLPPVHLHGPEHHRIVPCVLLTAYRNCGGSLELEPALEEALRRGRQVPGGTCGYWGVCGAAAGAGIFLSVLLGSTPLRGEVWSQPQRLTAACLADIAEVGGPRCCKRTARLAVTRAAAVTAELTGVTIPLGKILCRHYPQNKECIHRACPYFPGKGEDGHGTP